MEKRPIEDKMDKRPVLRDIWELILKIVLIILFVAWFVVQYIQGQGLSIFALVLLLIILAGLVALILRQKHFVLLRCNLTDPSGCVKGDTAILSGRVLEPISGDANGWGFSHYVLELRDPNGALVSDGLIYPNASGSPDVGATQGDYPVTTGKLGWVDVEKAVSAAGIALLTSTSFEITLRVFGVDGSEKTPPCVISFNVAANEVYIKRVSTPWSVDFTDPDEPLRRAEDSTAELSTVGGRLHVRGAANINIYGCAVENIDEYTIWAIPDPTFGFAQPAPFTTLTPGPQWVQMAHVEYKSQIIDGTTYTADDVRAYNVLDGDPDPQVLTNVWGTRTESRCFMVDWSLHYLSWKVPDLKARSFDTRSPLGTGKYTILLQVIDTSGNAFYDLQRVWVDNELVTANIEGIGGVASCQDLYTRNASGTFKTVEVQGTAWDALIDSADTTKPTSDNFHHYTVKCQKQGAAGEVELEDSPDPVPARPSPVGVGKLAEWDLSWLDKATNPHGLPTDQLLDKGEACTYDVALEVWDKTIVDEHRVHWSGRLTFPIKIVNAEQP